MRQTDPYQADQHRNRVENAERKTAQFLRSTLEDLLDHVQNVSAEFRDFARGPGLQDYAGNEDLIAAETRIKDVLKLAAM
jgi:hypothetical protein